MPEEIKDPTTGPVETGDEEKGKEDKPTLESMNAKLDAVIKENERLAKQNADKDSHISKIQGENKYLRDTVQKVSTSLEGKSETQKDAILERQRQKFIEQGYDAKSVDLILDTINEVADKKAQDRIVPVIMDSAQELIEADSEIDQSFLEKNNEAIMAEYHSYKQEVSPRKIKSNLKKAYNIVKDGLANKAKSTQKPKDEQEREAMLAGGRSGDSGKGKPQADDDFISSIEKAGSNNSHFI